MLIFLVSIIPFFLHLFGFHCNSEKQVITTSTIDFVTNFQLAFQDPLELFNSTKYTPYKRALTTDCVVYIRQVNEDLYYTCTDGNTTGCEYALLYVPQMFSDVPVCLYATNYSNIAISNPTGTRSESAQPYIFSDAFRVPDDELSWFRRTMTCWSDCVPPPHYYWNQTDNTYSCLDLEVCGLNTTIVTYTIDTMLESAGGTRLYSTTQNDRDYKAAVRVSCGSDLKPNISVFSIPIFDFRLWVAMMVLGLMFFFLSKIKEH